MEKKQIFAGAFAILVIASLAFWLLPPPPAEEDVEVNEANTLIFSDLRALGLEDVLVDVTDKHVLVRYNEPPGFSNATAVFVIAAVHAPATERIIIQAFDNFQPKRETIAGTKVALAYANGELSEEEFTAMLNASSLE